MKKGINGLVSIYDGDTPNGGWGGTGANGKYLEEEEMKERHSDYDEETDGDGRKFVVIDYAEAINKASREGSNHALILMSILLSIVAVGLALLWRFN